MIRLIIDGFDCPIADKAVTLPQYNASKLKSAEAWRKGDEMVIRVSSTPATDQIMHHASDIYHSSKFNDDYHTATLQVDGVTLFEGMATLLGVERYDGQILYRLLLRSGGESWAKQAAQHRLADTQIEHHSIMTLRGIANTWHGESSVRFLPLWRDRYPEKSDTGLYTPQTTIMPHDYHPFISLRALLEAMVSEGGYTLQSNFIGSEFFNKLMISGAYPHLKSDTAYATMGFKAYKSKSTTDVADSSGRVYAWLPLFASNVGCIVDTVSPNATDESGNLLSGAYTNGNCLTFSEGKPVFTPTREISVAFDYHILYTTEYSIASSSQLKGFDTIQIGSDCTVKIELHNPFVDRRAEMRPNQEYKLMIFDYNSGDTYRLGDFATVSEAISNITTSGDTAATTELYVCKAGSTEWVSYTGDWALYDGYVEPTGQRKVDITVRSPFKLLSPSSPELFNEILFEGAEPGQHFTLHSGCSVTPVFGGVAGYGEVVEFKDVAHHSFTQAELLEAIMHMFNLRIYSHKPSRTLYIEPYDDLYHNSVADWRTRQVRGGSLTLDDGAVECFESTRLAYRPSDGVVQRVYDTNGTTLGEWHFDIESYATKQGTKSIINPLFSPTISLTGYHCQAPSAKILTTGDRDIIPTNDYVEPRVVIYEGLAELPATESWGHTARERAYPLAVFHDAELGESLCFEDRDGCQGLHRYYDNELRERAERESYTCQLYLPPAEYAALFDLRNEVNICSLFRLTVGSNSSLFRLERIEEYNTESYVATCTFRRTFQD